MSSPLFSLGQIVSTPGALEALKAEGTNGLELLRRHLSGEWGDLCEDDRRENVLSVKEGFRILSAYRLSRTGVKLWIITEAGPQRYDVPFAGGILSPASPVCQCGLSRLCATRRQRGRPRDTSPEAQFKGAADDFRLWSSLIGFITKDTIVRRRPPQPDFLDAVIVVITAFSADTEPPSRAPSRRDRSTIAFGRGNVRIGPSKQLGGLQPPGSTGKFRIGESIKAPSQLALHTP
jgi:hypothetical protein